MVLAYGTRVGVALYALMAAADAGTVQQQLTLHVNKQAQDFSGGFGADGSTIRPFPTITAARDHLRALRQQGALASTQVKVSIAPGVYPPLELLPIDSGTP